LSWYLGRNARAAEEFFAELNRATEAIVDNPNRWPLDASGSATIVFADSHSSSSTVTN
jgi:hypothetical protein